MHYAALDLSAPAFESPATDGWYGVSESLYK